MKMTIVQLEGEVTRVTLEGTMNATGASSIDLQFNVIAARGNKLVIDLEKVDFLASMGVRTLVMGAKACKLKGGMTVIMNPNTEVESVLIASGIDSIIPIAHGLDSALSLLQA